MPVIPENDLKYTGLQSYKTPDLVDDDPDFWGTTVPAAFRMENTIFSLISDKSPDLKGVEDPNFDPFENLEPEYLGPNADRFVFADTPADVSAIKLQINREIEDDKTLAESGGFGIIASMTAGVLDPINFIPVGGAAYKTYRTGGSILRNAVSTAQAGLLSSTAAEAALQHTQMTRTYGESAANIAASAVFSGILGGSISVARNMIKGSGRSLNDIQANMENDLTINSGSVGAAKINDLDFESISKIESDVKKMVAEGKISEAEEGIEVGKRITNELLNREGIQKNKAVDASLKLMGSVTPDLRVLQSPSQVTRGIGQELFETSLVLGKNEIGDGTQSVATPVSVDALIRGYNAPEYRALIGMDEDFKKYIYGRSKKFGGIVKYEVGRKMNYYKGKMSFREYREAIGKSLRRNEDASSLDGVPEDAIPHINNSAKRFRSEVYEPTTQKAIQAGLLPEDVDPKTAETYLNRVYDLDKLAQPEVQKRFISITSEWLARRQQKAQESVDEYDIEYGKLKDELKNIRREIRSVGEGVRKGTVSGVIKETTEATDAAVVALQSRLETSINATAARMKFADKAKTAAVSKFFKTLQKDISETIEEATGVAVEREATGALDDLIVKADDLFDEELLPIIRDELAIVGKEVASEAAIAAIPKALKLSINEASFKAQKTFENSLKKQESQLKKLLNDPEAATSKALNDIRKNIAKTARKESEIAVRSGTKELRDKLKEQIKILTQKKKLHRRNLKEIEMQPSEFDNLAKEILDRIKGTPVGRLPYDVSIDRIRSRGQSSGGKAGPLKARVFMIPDNLIEEFLVNDIEQVSKRFIRSIAPDIELTKKFGDIEMTEQFKKIQDDYNILQRNNSADQMQLEKLKIRDFEDLKAIRDTLRNVYGLPENPMHWGVRIGRSLRQLNYIRLLGGMTVSAFPDMARPVMVHGFERVFGDAINPLITNFSAMGKLTQQMRDMGLATDMIMNSRMKQIADVTDDFSRVSMIERGLGAASDTMGMVSLMAPWNTAFKQMSAVISMNRMIRAIDAEIAGTIKKKEITYLRQNYIGKEEAISIRKMLDEHGNVEDGVQMPNALKWTDSSAYDVFQAALNRDVNRIIVTPGMDKPLTATKNEFGRQIFQFKSFAIAASQRIMLAGLQQKDAAALSGMLFAVSLGMLSGAFKMWDSGRGDQLKDWTMQKWIAEGVDRSGITGWFFEANNMIEKVTRGHVGVSAVTGAPPMSRYASRNVMNALLGPSAGTIETAARVSGSSFSTVLGDDSWKASDTHAIRKLLPYQNLILIRQMLDRAETKINSSIGAK